MHAIGSDPAFIFIDPTGWTGAAIRYIEPLLDGRFRDVMIRVPSEIYRFKDRGKSGDRTAGCSVRWHPRDPGALGAESGRFHRDVPTRIREVCKVPYAAQLY